MLEYTILNDIKLLALIKESDEKAFSEFYRRNWKKMYNSAYKRLQSSDQCKDVIQNIFADIWANREVLNVLNIQAYLHSAVRYQVYKIASKYSQTTTYLSVFEEIIQSNYYADSNLQEDEALRLLNLWIEALPEKRRIIFQLFYFENLTTAEIACRLKISQKTVQNQLLSATGLIKENLQQLLYCSYFLIYVHTL